MWTLEAGRSTSRASYGQLRETVVVKGMKKFSKDTNGLVAVSLSRSLGLELVSGLNNKLQGWKRHTMADDQTSRGDQRKVATVVE